jgi:hypothetical protein
VELTPAPPAAGEFAMPCVVGCLALTVPRLLLALVWLFSNYLGEAYQTVIWPLLGFFFMPYTTLAYAWAWHHGGGTIVGIDLVVVVLAVLLDLGSNGSGEASRRNYHNRSRNQAGGA